ncbi:MAG: prolipoprotein diacylglyceryl transferase [Alphaproteobacteria bacterium]
MTHDFNLTFAHIFGLPLYWYGAVYTIGFLGILGWFWSRRQAMGWSPANVFDYVIFISAGILIGGRAFDIAVYELDYYRVHPLHAFDWWRGGLATHGVLLGAAAGTAIFCKLRGKSFLATIDQAVVPAAFLFAIGRVGNFLEGGVIGSATTLPWGVLYPDLDSARHPVALYESAKNFAIIPILIWVLARYPAGRGVATGAFIFLYAALRFMVDLFRDYESAWLGLGKGQFFNLAMALIGLAIAVVCLRRNQPAPPKNDSPVRTAPIGLLRIAIIAFLCLYPLGIPTSWTRVNIEDKRQSGILGQERTTAIRLPADDNRFIIAAPG